MSGRPAGLSDDDTDSDDLDFSPVKQNSRQDTATQVQTSRISIAIKPSTPNGVSLPSSVKSIDLDDVRMAAVKGNAELIEKLLAAGLAPDTVLKSGWSALMYAGYAGQPKVVEILLNAGADPNFHKDLYTAFMTVCASACDNEDALLQCAKFMLDKKALVNAAERHRLTPLMFASKEGRLHLARLLIEQKADLNSQDSKGWTALMWAAIQGHGHVVRLLLDKGANPKVLNLGGQAAADVALAARYPEIKDVLEGRIKTIEAHKKAPNELKTIKASEVTELEMILMGLELSNLLPVFQKHGVNFFAFLCLTEEDLDKMGIQQVGVRVRVLQAIKEIHTREWKRSSLPALHYNKNISCPEAVALVGNIAKQLRYMEASVAYLRAQLEKKPRILELGQQAASLSDLSQNCESSLRHSTNLQKQVKFLHSYLSKLEGKAEYIPADLIIEKSQKGGEGWSWSRMLTLMAVSAMGCVVVWRTPRLWGSSVILLTL